MIEGLSERDREFFNYLRVYCQRVKHKGYIAYLDSKTKKKYKRSRVLYQIFNDVQLNKFDIIHHKDGNKENDHIDNLEILTPEEHVSHHFAGRRCAK